MTPTSDIRRRAVELIEQLPLERLTPIVQLLEVLSSDSQQLGSESQESALLEVIQRRLPPDQQARLQELRDRCEWGELTNTEHEELIQYEDQLEQWRVERLEALIELAKLRNIDLPTLNRQFVVTSQPSHAA